MFIQPFAVTEPSYDEGINFYFLILWNFYFLTYVYFKYIENCSINNI
jgi:hypothetical protein